jgi:hypothetical protein
MTAPINVDIAREQLKQAARDLVHHEYANHSTVDIEAATRGLTDAAFTLAACVLAAQTGAPQAIPRSRIERLAREMLSYMGEQTGRVRGLTAMLISLGRTIAEDRTQDPGDPARRGPSVG